jgi:hypothetical protein
MKDSNFKRKFRAFKCSFSIILSNQVLPFHYLAEIFIMGEVINQSLVDWLPVIAFESK